MEECVTQREDTVHIFCCRMSVEEELSVAFAEFVLGEKERKENPTIFFTNKNSELLLSRWPCKDYLEGTCTNSVKRGTLQKAYPTRPKRDAGLGRSARMHIVRLMNNLVKGPKIMGTKVKWLC